MQRYHNSGCQTIQSHVKSYIKVTKNQKTSTLPSIIFGTLLLLRSSSFKKKASSFRWAFRGLSLENTYRTKACKLTRSMPGAQQGNIPLHRIKPRNSGEGAASNNKKTDFSHEATFYSARVTTFF